MNRLLITTLALSAVLITGAFAEKEKKGEGDKPKHHPPRMENLLPQPLLEKLNLTAEQRAEYEKLEQQFDAERDKYQAAHKAEMEKLREESKVAKEGNDEAKLKEARQKRAELGKPMMELRKSYVDKFAATLTPEIGRAHV